jgi:hypothetical protein
MKQPIDSKCRICCKAKEHIKHIVAGCTTLAPSEYLIDTVRWLANIHWMICKHLGLHCTDKYYEHVPNRVINVKGTTIMWDVTVITIQSILPN